MCFCGMKGEKKALRICVGSGFYVWLETIDV